MVQLVLGAAESRQGAGSMNVSGGRQDSMDPPGPSRPMGSTWLGADRQGQAEGTWEAHALQCCVPAGRISSSKPLGNGSSSKGEFPQEASASSYSDKAGNSLSKHLVSAAHGRCCLEKALCSSTREEHPVLRDAEPLITRGTQPAPTAQMRPSV